jgi:hypothetical protein
MSNIENIDLCITFDTTGSMYPALTQVRRNITNLVKDLMNVAHGLRIAIIAHGDYCDVNRPYVTKILDFTSDLNKIVNFVQTVEQTGGGDAPECYELVLNQSRTLNWQSGKSKVVVMIGDDVPHGPNYPQNTQKIDWRNELGLLLEAGINVYGVHALAGCRQHSKKFYEEIAQKTGGFYLTLDQFSSINDLIMSIAAKQNGDETLETFAQTVKNAGRMTKNLGQAIGTMLNKTTSYFAPEFFVTKTSSNSSTDLIPVPSGRFQAMRVDEDTVICDFVRDQGVTFQKGRGFYELTKSEEIQGYKEIVLMDKHSGELFNGSQVRRILGLTEGVKGRLSSHNLLSTYKIFIQSTSYNRKLKGNTMFLYEVNDWEM